MATPPTRRKPALFGRGTWPEASRIGDILRSAPDIPLKEVAYRVGMANGNLLSRWLRRELNLTSRQVRATGVDARQDRA